MEHNDTQWCTAIHNGTQWYTMIHNKNGQRNTKKNTIIRNKRSDRPTNQLPFKVWLRKLFLLFHYFQRSLLEFLIKREASSALSILFFTLLFSASFLTFLSSSLGSDSFVHAGILIPHASSSNPAFGRSWSSICRDKRKTFQTHQRHAIWQNGPKCVWRIWCIWCVYVFEISLKDVDRIWRIWRIYVFDFILKFFWMPVFDVFGVFMYLIFPQFF